ncbi:toxin-antitoxin system YwqK family antitoxin [Aureispira anguillae]|uniref:Antitoxin component YwqK of the YwqJK toxin-antitoxin module n=1 Tax=Aureispira anguillae TaxID=2864201 RepID=A0A915YGP0_9BACT|nr:hypothetical protein [Aureispira anguillae]BDS12830.1 hypothetical protein AsAng_0035550 [Aureispira anguillae]
MQIKNYYCYLCLLLLLGNTQILACNTSEHHSVLNHYNHAKKIFEGKAIRVGKLHQKKLSFEDKETGLRSIFVKFEVIKNYKNTLVKEELIIGVQPGLYADFKAGERYLIYANEKVGYDFLICEKGFNTADQEAIDVHRFLFQIPVHHTGYLVEYSIFGRKWAEGMLKDGLPVGEWKYYSKSGELQIKGHYKAGEEIGEWEYFYHTNDKSYCILDQIITGAYHQKTGTYQLLAMDSSLTGLFKNQIKYIVGADTLVEYFYYNNQLKQKNIGYENGLRHGIEKRFNEQGICISVYQFQQGKLEGSFWELKELRGEKERYLKVEGSYRADKKYDERHLYYENDILARTKEVLKNGKLL